MTLDPSYLSYPMRRHGMDHGLYSWSNIFERKSMHWPDGKTVAVCLIVPLEYFPLLPNDKPFKVPGHMQTPYPDLRHYSAREYGTRIGFYRFLDAFSKAGIKASIAVQSAIAERYPSIISDIETAGHEIIAHSTDANGLQFGGMDEKVEQTLIHNALETLARVCRKRPVGWMSVAQSESWNTGKLLAAAGIQYSCNWTNDDLPYRQQSIMALPVNHELSDRQMISVCQHSAEDWAVQVKDAYAWLAKEAQHHGGRMLTLTLTPYILGLPYRIAAVEDTLAWLAAQPQNWIATGAEIIDCWTGQNP
jgi:allantoinase